MGTFYRANKELEDYLVQLGLTFHDRGGEEEVKYFTDHSSGKQVKIDNNKNIISLLTPTGETLDFSSSFTDNQLQAFLSNEQ